MTRSNSNGSATLMAAQHFEKLVPCFSVCQTSHGLGFQARPFYGATVLHLISSSEYLRVAHSIENNQHTKCMEYNVHV